MNAPALHLVSGQRELTDVQRAEVTKIWRQNFLRSLHPEGYRYLAALHGPGEPWTENVSHGNLASVEDFITEFSDRDLYFGVATRIDDKHRDAAHCGALYALFADFDFEDIAEEEVRRRLDVFWQPRAVVRSGGGLHVYWFLEKPIYLQNGSARAKAILQILAKSLGADESSAEPAHILRIPGTLNRKPKYGAPRAVALEYTNGRKYSLDEILSKLPQIPDVKEEKPKEPIKHGLSVEERI